MKHLTTKKCSRISGRKRKKNLSSLTFINMQVKEGFNSFFPICNFTILNFVNKSVFAFSNNCFEVSMILSYLDKNKQFSFRNVAKLQSKGSCELAVSTLAWTQVFQGMRRLNIFPIFPPARPEDCSQSKDQDEQKSVGNKKSSPLYKTKYWRAHLAPEHPQGIYYLHPPSCWKSISAVVPCFFFQPLQVTFFAPSHTVFLLETSLTEAKSSSPLIRVSSHTACSHGI